MFTTRGRALSCISQGENMPGRLFFMASHICHHILPAFCTECWHPVSVNNITTARWSTLDGFSITLVNVSQSAACGENGGRTRMCSHVHWSVVITLPMTPSRSQQYKQVSFDHTSHKSYTWWQIWQSGFDAFNSNNDYNPLKCTWHLVALTITEVMTKLGA